VKKKQTAILKRRESGIFYGYVIVLVSFVLQALGWGIFNSFGVFLKPMMDEFSWQRAVISSGITFSILVFGIGGILQGRLSDRFGPRMTLTAGGILLGAGYLLMSQVSTVCHLYIFFSLLIGLGISGTDVVALSTTARWFVKKRGMMSGIIKVGTGVGMLVMPVMINRIITSYGWRSAFVVLGAMVLLLYVSGSQFLVRDPGKMGLVPDGERHKKPLDPSPPEQGMTLQQAAHTVQFWIACFAFFIILFCAATVLMHIVAHAIDLGITADNAAKVLSTVGGASIAGRFVMGSAGDRIGNRSALTICFMCLASGMVWLQIADMLWMLLLFAIVYGFAHGGFYALISPLIAELFGTRAHGIILGIALFASTIGGSLGPVTAGYIFDMTGSYGAVFAILTGMSIAGLLAALTLRPTIRNS
jgi:MFS family permease